MDLGELVEPVAEAPPGVEVEAHQHRVVDRRDVDPGLVEHHPVIFEIMPDLEDRRVFEQRLQPFEHKRLRKLVGRVRIEIAAAVADRNVAGAVGRGREADPGEPGDDAVDAVGLGVDRDIALGRRLGDPAVERGLVGHGLIFRPVDLDLLGLRGTAGSSAPLPP